MCGNNSPPPSCSELDCAAADVVDLGGGRCSFTECGRGGGGESLALNWGGGGGGGPGGHRVGTGPREQLSRQFYSTPIFTLPSVSNVCMIICELWVTI